MKKSEIKTRLSDLISNVDNSEVEINIFLMEQNNQRKKPYKGFVLKFQRSDIKEVILTTLSYILVELDKRTLDTYDLDISFDESIQIVDKKDAIHGDEILSEITVKHTKQNTIDKNTDLSKIKFMVIQLYNPQRDESIYLFKKYIQPSTAYKTSEKYIFVGSTLKPFTENIITINYLVDAFLIDDKYYVLNRNNFNSMFSFKDVFFKIVEANTMNIKDSGLLTESDQFIMDCESDGRYLKRLTKAILAKGFDEVGNKRGNIPDVIQKFNLSLESSAEGQIIYRGKQDIPELLNLLLRHYVIDALTNSKMIAAAIQEYEAIPKGGTSK